MRSQIFKLMAIVLLLSACARTDPSNPSSLGHDRVAQRSETNRHNAETTPSPVRRPHHEADHHHDYPPPGPTPEEEYAATVALLISAQIFTCAFVVVILDGSCNFYASTGYYY